MFLVEKLRISSMLNLNNIDRNFVPIVNIQNVVFIDKLILSPQTNGA